MNTLRSTLGPLARDGHERLAWQIAAGLLAGLVVVWLAGQSFHARRASDPPAPAASSEILRADATRPAATRTIRFVDVGRDLVAHDADQGKVIKPLGFEKDGFVVSIVRSLDRERKRLGLAPGSPYRLTRWDNGQLLLEDPTTGSQMEFSPFGATNVAAFASLLADPLTGPKR